MEEEYVDIVDRMGGEHSVPKRIRFLDPLDECCHITGELCTLKDCDACDHAKRNDGSMDAILKFCQ